MIFITLGSQKFQFNRLLKAVDQQVCEGKIQDKIFAQIGASDYRPQYYSFKDFLGRNEFAELIDKSDIVITHGGTGVIIGSIKKEKKVIAVPRLQKYGEHVDDHQLQLLTQFEKLDLICVCYDCDQIWKTIEEVKLKEYKKYISNTDKILKSIETFIEEL